MVGSRGVQGGGLGVCWESGSGLVALQFRVLVSGFRYALLVSEIRDIQENRILSCYNLVFPNPQPF